MRGRTIVLLTAAAASLAATLGTTPSVAVTAATWTVKPGGRFSGSYNRSFQMIDSKTGAGEDCPSSSLSGKLKKGSGLTGSDLGSVISISDTDCLPPAGEGITFSNLPYVLTASSYSSGTTTGRITGIHAAGTGTGCYFVIDGTSANADNGSIEVTYSNSTGKLKFSSGGNLHVYDVIGCYGFFKDGNSVTPTDTFTLSPKQTITSP